jgi:hypothetical protein
MMTSHLNTAAEPSSETTCKSDIPQTVKNVQQDFFFSVDPLILLFIISLEASI